MKERPILFSAPMVRAILDGKKTMARWVVEPQPDDDGRVDTNNGIAYIRGATGGQCTRLPCPYGVPGDRILAGDVTLEITGVIVEQLQEITEEDAREEGITDGGCLNCGNHEPCNCSDPQPDAKDSFIWLWDSINAKRGYSWESNPWVWVVEFEAIP